MGGKQRQAQRIKNNARPSSSGRSAELLASSSQIPQFSAGKEIRFIPPTLSLLKTDEFDSSVSPDFQIVFKKMNKKDSTTKLKALQEFSDLIANSEVDGIKPILAFWATLYSSLATDTDHRVREAAHSANYQVILKDKKIIAPYLKQLIGPWFTSQYDNYPPAASAALKSFSAAFPPHKVKECVIFCQKEILSYIFENLTSKVDSNPKHGTNEDAEAKFERIIVSTLQGYCLYLDSVDQEQIRKCEEQNKEIIGNSRFLKLSGHKTAIIRASFFKVLATLYHKAPFLLEGQEGHVVPMVFGAMDESEPAVVSFVWEAALLIMDGGQDWWKHIHIEKQYLQKLRKVLRDGGQGNASAIYPNLLSFLHKLPPGVKLDQFYDSFFENLRLGLKKKNVQSSKSETTAVVTAVTECLQYVVLTNHKDADLCDKLIKSHLSPLVEWSLVENPTNQKTVYQKIAALAQYWSRNKTIDNYPRYSKLFWTDVNMLFQTAVANLRDENLDEILEKQKTLLQYLKNVAKPKDCHMKVTFVESGEISGGDCKTQKSPDIDDSYGWEVKVLVYTTLKSLVECVQDHKRARVLEHLFSIVQMFENREFFVGLSGYLNEGQTNENLVDIYKIFLYKWLNCEHLCSETVVDLTFVLVKYLTVEEKSFVLNTFLEFYGKECFSWCVKNAFSHPYKNDLEVQKWLKNKEVGDFLVTTTEANLDEDCPPNVKILFKLMFAENSNGDLLIDKETISRVTEKLRKPLENPSEFWSCIDSCAQLASYISEIIYTETHLLKCGDDLLLSLFKLSCQNPSELETLTRDTLWEVNTSWQDAVTVLSKNLDGDEFENLIHKFARVVEENFLATFPGDVRIRILTDVIVSFVRATFNGRPMIITDVFNIFIRRDFVPDWKNDVCRLCVFAEYLKGNLCSPYDNLEKYNRHMSDEDILRFFSWNSLKCSILSAPLQDSSEIDEYEDDEITDVKEIIYSIDDNPQLIVEILYDLTTAQTFLEHYKMTKYYSNVTETVKIVKTNLTYLFDNLNLKQTIKDNLTEKLSSESWLWCKATFILYTEISPMPPLEIHKHFSKSSNKLSKLHLSQLLGRHLSFDDVQFMHSVSEDAVILRSQLHCDEIDVQIAEVFEIIKKLRNKNNPRFLFENRDMTWGESEEIIEVIRLFSRLISEKFDCLSRQHWDFGLLSLASWATNICNKARNSYENEQIQAFMIAVMEFYINLCKKIDELKARGEKNNFVEEWETLFLPNIHPDMLQLWLFLSEQFASKSSLPVGAQPFLQEFGRIIAHFKFSYVFNKENSLPHWSKILKRCNGLLTNSSPILQLWGYKMLIILVPGLVETDWKINTSDTPNTRGFTSEQFREVLGETHNIVNDILIGFKLGEDSCQIKPFTDSYTYVFGYLLVWSVLFNLCEKSPPELRYQYADWLRNDNYFKTLLNNLFKLMPTEILHYSEGKTRSCIKMFQKPPALDFTDPCTSEQIEQLSCWVYNFCLSQLPALVRQWWSETDTKVSQIVEKVTAFYVSQQLCNQELQDVAQNETKFKNMTIKTIPSVREVIAVYTVDEAQMELVITLPQNYPLGGPDVKCNRQIGGALHKQWLMQLKKCLLHQNGRVWDGLSLWNSNLDKKFDGVEECYICFAVLHPGTYQLPKLSCQTCKKKFHSACLYKWFSTSNKSSCPICRNLF